MQIVLVTTGLKFNGDTLKTQSLGGSETAMLCMARELAALGHDVRVYCSCDRPGIYDDVQYYHMEQFLSQNRFNNIDVLISSRQPGFLAAPVRAGLRVLWCHDVAPKSADAKQWFSALYQTDMVMLLSEFHREDFRRSVPDLDKHVWLTSNGVDLDLIDSNLRPKVPGKLFYSSRPERGLHFLLKDIMPQLLKSHPHAKLHVCTYDLSSLKVEGAEPLWKLYRECERLAEELPNVVQMPSLTKQQLYQHMSSSELLLYPTNFPEVSCITAMEAQSCGTPMITTDAFALSETLGDGCGVKIDIPQPDPAYKAAFLDATRSLLDDAGKRNQLAIAGREFVRSRGYVWSEVAKKWSEEFERRLDSRVSNQTASVYKNLLRKNDAVAAVRLAERFGLKTVDEKPVLSISDLHAASKVLEEAEIVAEFRSALQGRYTQGFELLRYIGHQPQRILEYSAGSVSAGIAYAKWISGSEIVIYAPDEIAASQLRRHLAVSKLDNATVVTETSEISGQFDVVVLDEVVDDVEVPSAFVDTVRRNYLTDNGVVLMFNRFGTDRTCYDGTFDRFWDFDVTDLQSMFGDSPDFATTIHCSDSNGEVAVNAIEEPLGHLITVFRNSDLSSKKLQLGSKYRKTRPYQSVGVCMIASNEEDWISGAIKSVKSIADSVRVVINNSYDSTGDICRSLGATVVEEEFDNFSQIRNASLEGMSTDWIIWIDSDERLVNAGKVKKYLDGVLFNGYAIRQNHLMLDMPNSFDLPIRLFRNNPDYRFTGCIHEHCEDTSKQPFDDPISPTLMVPDVDIAHYGYLNERTRRFKCSARNLSLLIRDVQENGDKRLLTWVLVIRDYLNMVKWSFGRQKNSQIVSGTFEHACVFSAIATFVNKFEGTGHRYEELARPMYQEALSLLGENEIPIRGQVPFEIGLALFGACGGLEDKNIKPSTQWFRSVAEYQHFMSKNASALSQSMGIPSHEAAKDYLETFEEPPHVELLSKGLNMFEGHTV